ncbi:MAG: septal ring lytic transglycosylase RlpA family protein [Betaproteobacteria bacterium]
MKRSSMFVHRGGANLLPCARLAVAILLCSSAVMASCGSLRPGEEGLASVYAEHFNGKRTASGDVYDSKLATAAHRTLAFGTSVRVTNLANGKSVIVRVNDRGPHVAGRIVDLSGSAGAALGLKGVTRVKLEVLKPGAS